MLTPDEAAAAIADTDVRRLEAARTRLGHAIAEFGAIGESAYTAAARAVANRARERLAPVRVDIPRNQIAEDSVGVAQMILAFEAEREQEAREQGR